MNPAPNVVGQFFTLFAVSILAAAIVYGAQFRDRDPAWRQRMTFLGAAITTLLLLYRACS